MRRLLRRLYPGAWRRRYGDEFESILDDRSLRPSDVVDVGQGAVDAHIRVRRRPFRGLIVFTEKFDGSNQTSPITGGTGEFMGATGTVTAKLPPSGNGDFVITIVR